jgi:hypothetical protein
MPLHLNRPIITVLFAQPSDEELDRPVLRPGPILIRLTNSAESDVPAHASVAINPMLRIPRQPPITERLKRNEWIILGVNDQRRNPDRRPRYPIALACA